jgi:hypothetical protein
MTIVVFCSFLGLLCGLYFALIGPILFKFWIMPRIGKRYNTKLVIDNPLYKMPFPNWGIPVWEFPIYIIAKLYGFDKKINSRITLKKINYQITEESKPEIIMSFVSLFFLVVLIVSGIIVVSAGK